jgi:hypothetical protein
MSPTEATSSLRPNEPKTPCSKPWRKFSEAAASCPFSDHLAFQTRFRTRSRMQCRLLLGHDLRSFLLLHLRSRHRCSRLTLPPVHFLPRYLPRARMRVHLRCQLYQLRLSVSYLAAYTYRTTLRIHRCISIFIRSVIPNLTMLKPDHLAILATLALTAFIYIRTRKRSRHPLPPGPRKLPLLGNLFDLPTSHEWLTYAKLCKDYSMYGGP